MIFIQSLSFHSIPLAKVKENAQVQIKVSYQKANHLVRCKNSSVGICQLYWTKSNGDSCSVGILFKAHNESSVNACSPCKSALLPWGKCYSSERCLTISRAVESFYLYVKAKFQGTRQECVQGCPRTYGCVSSYTCPFISRIAIAILKHHLIASIFITGTAELRHRAVCALQGL